MTVEKLAAILGKELDTETRVEGENVFFSFEGLELIATNLDAELVRIFSVVIDEDTPDVPDEDILRMVNAVSKEEPVAKCVFLTRDETGVYYRICVENRCNEKELERNVKNWCEIFVRAMMRFIVGLHQLAGK